MPFISLNPTFHSLGRIRGLFDNLEATLADPTVVDVLVGIDAEDVAMQCRMAAEAHIWAVEQEQVGARDRKETGRRKSCTSSKRRVARCLRNFATACRGSPSP